LRETVGQVADECRSREGRFLRDEERAATFPTSRPASGASAKLTAQNNRDPDQPQGLVWRRLAGSLNNPLNTLIIGAYGRRRRLQAVFCPADTTAMVDVIRAIVAALKMVDAGRDHLRAVS